MASETTATQVASQVEAAVEKVEETVTKQDAPAEAPAAPAPAPSAGSAQETITLDLVNLTLKHIMLCAAVDTWPKGGLYDSPYVTNAIKRYERLWLPMMAKAPAKELHKIVAPLDIAWIWHMHRMDPVKYREDCEALVGKVIEVPVEGAFNFSDGTDAQVKPTMHLWAKQTKYEYYPPKLGPDAFSKTHKATADLHGNAHRHGVVVLQVLRAAYQQRPFVESAVQRYFKVLDLLRSHPDMKVVLPADVDFVWRTHMSVHQAYHADMTALFSKLPNIRDWTAAAPGALDAEFKATVQAWTAKYPGEPFMTKGTEFVPEKLMHPAKALVPHAIKLFYNDMAWRAGGHALYLLFLMSQGRATVHSKKGEADLRLQTGRYVAKYGSGFRTFQGLPHSSQHRFFSAFKLGEDSDVMALLTTLTPAAPRSRQGKGPVPGSEFNAEFDCRIFGAVSMSEDDGMTLEGNTKVLEKPAGDGKATVAATPETKAATASTDGAAAAATEGAPAAAEGAKAAEPVAQPLAAETEKAPKRGLLCCFAA